MGSPRRTWASVSALLVMLSLGAVSPLGAQILPRTKSQRGQPKTPFAAADFAKLRWLDGKWIGSPVGGAPDQRPVYEQFVFSSDSTADITYYRDSTFSQPIGNGRLYLTVGRIYHTFGPNRWGATHVDDDGVFFIPQVTALNSFSWKRTSPATWKSTLREGPAGQMRVIVWEMHRPS